MTRTARTTVAAVLPFLFACGGGDDGGPGPSNDDGPSNGGGFELSDADVSGLARASSGWTWYRNRPDTLSKSSGSGHVEARLRTRYNAQAAGQLDMDGRVRSDAVFPEGSLIVKELISESTLVRYAVMLKAPSSQNAGAGWLWAYYAPDGSPQISITGRGAACVACHSSGIDHTRMNDSFP